MPDQAPYSLLLSHMVPWLVEAGHEVNIITAQPAYKQDAVQSPKKEVLFGASVYRLPLLPSFMPKAGFLNTILFCIFAALRVLFTRKSDVVGFGTTPPVIQALLVGIAARLRSSKTIYQMQDVHPEIAIQSIS